MSRITWRPALIVGLRLVSTFLFAPAILAKLRHPDEWARLFATWGYPAWGAMAVSCAEIGGLAALWIPRLAGVASVVLMITLAGATGTWLVHGPRETAAYPGTILVLVVSLAWLVKRSPR
jgi:uncharacterized membrane protein YphA (DoxX/SURF4 family)